MDNKFSLPIKADPDAYYMSTPEVVAKHIATQLKPYHSAVELCCAVGMTAIQLAEVMDHVYGVDMDSKRLSDARDNAELYGVADKVTFLQGDVLDESLLATIKAEVVILDPDWSAAGAESKSQHVSSFDDTQPSMRQMMQLARKHISHNIVARAPKTFTQEILEQEGFCRVENIIWGDKLRLKVVYYLEDSKGYSEKDILFNL